MKSKCKSVAAISLVISLWLMPLALSAAITDSDLAKVTQLIQEGKTTRAKAEITILLDDNPKDPNAPKLRKILDSIGKSETTTTISSTAKAIRCENVNRAKQIAGIFTCCGRAN